MTTCAVIGCTEPALPWAIEAEQKNGDRIEVPLCRRHMRDHGGVTPPAKGREA